MRRIIPFVLLIIGSVASFAQTIDFEAQCTTGCPSLYASAGPALPASPNLSSGQNVIGFAATGSVVTVMATSGQAVAGGGFLWDFFSVSRAHPLTP